MVQEGGIANPMYDNLKPKDDPHYASLDVATGGGDQNGNAGPLPEKKPLDGEA